jgi:hypothetical protein
MAHRTTMREKMSSTTARERQPSHVHTPVISATHSVLGALARPVAVQQIRSHRMLMLAIGRADAMRASFGA